MAKIIGYRLKPIEEYKGIKYQHCTLYLASEIKPNGTTTLEGAGVTVFNENIKVDIVREFLASNKKSNLNDLLNTDVNLLYNRFKKVEKIVNA